MSDNELTLTYIDGLMRGREEAAEQLAAAQAREAQLREVLNAVKARLDRNGMSGRQLPEYSLIANALALPTDDLGDS